MTHLFRIIRLLAIAAPHVAAVALINFDDGVGSEHGAFVLTVRQHCRVFASPDGKDQVTTFFKGDQVQLLACGHKAFRVKKLRSGSVGWISATDVEMPAPGVIEDFLAKQNEENRINAGKRGRYVVVGMSPGDVFSVLGTPDSRTQISSESGSVEEWEYIRYRGRLEYGRFVEVPVSRTTVTFSGGSVSRVAKKDLTK